ncbi:MAG TPA: nucleotidyltransferase family protein, partial [Ktedonobacteraceae bacterium]|nr:nucleotidyltransferase family protein [Ktedonobacteraceae bacterium]
MRGYGVRPNVLRLMGYVRRGDPGGRPKPVASRLASVSAKRASCFAPGTGDHQGRPYRPQHAQRHSHMKNYANRVAVSSQRRDTCMPVPGSIAAIILAAGSSSRMGGGRHKLLLPLADRPVLAHVLDAALASVARPIILVLGHQSETVRASIADYLTHPDLIVVENPNYLEGMSTSMRTGIQTLLARQSPGVEEMPTSAGALILLGDQPLVTTEIINTLITAQQVTGKRIVAPLYEGKRGNPTLFAASLFPELLDVSGDEGGRSVLTTHKDELATVEVGSAVTNYDVDTWEAYQQVT